MEPLRWRWRNHCAVLQRVRTPPGGDDGLRTPELRRQCIRESISPTLASRRAEKESEMTYLIACGPPASLSPVCQRAASRDLQRDRIPSGTASRGLERTWTRELAMACASTRGSVSASSARHTPPLPMGAFPSLLFTALKA
ncbi:hypothetical protein NDU88_004732 [Pleurodeles waltl]|uniref:Uncharacterized protein n=1 Tax=Pleurodeles waltl TaxID=8319 RepID=A0AAV7WW01_PLEWA|nr:hypothetical protein NDU88_004730 [Pleurodeles waltl]KAJ1217137.1 hypothetical protein NDU88_004732 [Pleurodeles waltl]